MRAQSFLALGDPTDCSPPGSSVQGILQAGILEWVAMTSSRGSSASRLNKEWRMAAFPMLPGWTYIS